MTLRWIIFLINNLLTNNQHLLAEYEFFSMKKVKHLKLIWTFTLNVTVKYNSAAVKISDDITLHINLNTCLISCLRHISIISMRSVPPRQENMNSMEMFHNKSVYFLLILNIDTGRVSINSVMQDWKVLKESGLFYWLINRRKLWTDVLLLLQQCWC